MANCDMQVVVAADDTLGDLPADIRWSFEMGFDLVGLFEGVAAQVASMGSDRAEAALAAMKGRKYLDSGDYLERLIDYVVGYACKGEVSVKEAVGMFMSLMKDKDLADNASMLSVSQRMNCRLLKQREISAAEAVFMLGTNQNFHCSRPFLKLSLRPEQFNINATDDGSARMVVVANDLAKYWAAMTPKEGADPPLLQSFAEWSAKGGRGIPVYTGIPVRPTWPLSEAWARGALMCHKPTRSYAEVKGTFDTFVEAFLDFMKNPSGNQAAVTALAQEVRSAAVAVARGISVSARESAINRAGDALPGADMVCDGGGDDRPEVDAESGDFAEDPFSAGGEEGIKEAAEGYGGCGDLGECDYAVLQADVARSAEKQQEQQTTVRQLVVLEPTAPNPGQRAFLCDQVEFALRNFEDGRWLTKRQVFLVGLAGTGKTFTIDLLACAVIAITGRAAALAAFCPTGAAAGAARGRTSDAALGIKRSRKAYTPLKDATLAKLQKENIYTHCAVFDEAWMNGRKLFGHISAASKQVLRGGAADSDEDYFGSQVGLCILVGDPKQLPPVKDKLAFDDDLTGENILGLTGRNVYRSVRRAWFLAEPMRQREGELFNALAAVRDGKVQDTHAEFFMGLRKALVSDDQFKEFTGETGGKRTLFATCFNKDKDAINAKYICGFENVVVVKSINQGTHVQSNSTKTGPASSIPLISYYAIYMMVKLTLNLLPIEGLYNGARGIIVGIIFGENGYQRCAAGATAEVNMPIVVVNFPAYTGKRWFADSGGIDRSTWVPVAAATRRCDAGCCEGRTGIPLKAAKADSVHCCQGMSCGPEKAIEAICGLWSADAEKKWAGIFYVLASRVTRAQDLMLAPAGGASVVLHVDAFRQIGSTDLWRKTHEEVQKLRQMADNTRARARSQHIIWYGHDHVHGSEHHWRLLCQKVVECGKRHLRGDMAAADRDAVQSVVDAWDSD